MFADPEGVDPQPVGKCRLVDEISDYLSMAQRLAVGAVGDVAEGIQPEFEGLCHCARFNLPDSIMAARPQPVRLRSLRQVGSVRQRRNVAVTTVPAIRPGARREGP